MISAEITEKRRKAIIAALELVKDGSRIGLGSGSTVSQFIDELANYVKSKGINIEVISSSSQIDMEAPIHGLKLLSHADLTDLDLIFDSADEVDEEFNLLKGGGGALLREKVLHRAGKKSVILIEEEKLVRRLGIKHPIPVEVLPFAYSFVKKEIENEIGFMVQVRTSPGKVGPVITDNGNYILDVHTGPVSDPHSLETALRGIPGVLETGLFLNVKGVVIIGGCESVRKLEIQLGRSRRS